MFGNEENDPLLSIVKQHGKSEEDAALEAMINVMLAAQGIDNKIHIYTNAHGRRWALLFPRPTHMGRDRRISFTEDEECVAWVRNLFAIGAEGRE